jgi:glucose/arabinose dehydrogenase
MLRTPDRRVHRARWIGLILLVCAALLESSCFTMRHTQGGGMTEFEGERSALASDVTVPPGYRVEVVAEGLTFPVGATFDDQGRLYVVESGYVYGEIWKTPRLLRVEPNGSTTVIAEGTDNGPWNGVTYFAGNFYLAEGGEKHGGKILQISPDGRITTLVEGLPSTGDHHTNAVVIDGGWLYFGQGTATNSAVVGEDNASFGWVARHPDMHDIPCRDVTLTGQNFKTNDVRKPGSKETAETGAYVPFGTKTTKGQMIRGQIPCSGAILRIPLAGGPLELVAWGLRNPFALTFSPDHTLYALDNSYDDRGSRPVHGTGDLLWAIEPGGWYGWPDFHGTRRLDTGDHFHAPNHDKPQPLISEPPGIPSEPVAILGVHASADGIAFAPETFGYAGQAFVAEFGDQSPAVGKVLNPVGFRVVRVSTSDGAIEEFAINRGKGMGPASRRGTHGLERPVGVRFSPDGRSLYVVDFGVLLMDHDGAHAKEKTGVIWRITNSGAPTARRQ